MCVSAGVIVSVCVYERVRDTHTHNTNLIKLLQKLLAERNAFSTFERKEGHCGVDGTPCTGYDFVVVTFCIYFQQVHVIADVICIHRSGSAGSRGLE